MRARELARQKARRGESLSAVHVAALFRTDSVCVLRWAKEGRYGAHRLPGGSWWFNGAAVWAAFEEASRA